MVMTANLLLKGGRLVDPAAGIDGDRDVLIDGGRIARDWRRSPGGRRHDASSSCRLASSSRPA